MTSRFQLPPIVKDAQVLLADIERAVRLFPRYYRYAIGTDMADHFEPDAGFLLTIPGAAIIQAVTETKGAKAAKGLAGLKKAELAGKAATLIGGSCWVPAVLRGPEKTEAKPAKKTAAKKKVK